MLVFVQHSSDLCSNGYLDLSLAGYGLFSHFHASLNQAAFPELQDFIKHTLIVHSHTDDLGVLKLKTKGTAASYHKCPETHMNRKEKEKGLS